MPHIPRPTRWKSLAERQNPDRDYLLLLTHLPVRRLSRLPRFLRYVRKIRQQLDLYTDRLLATTCWPNR